jgi:hypothetical protein
VHGAHDDNKLGYVFHTNKNYFLPSVMYILLILLSAITYFLSSTSRFEYTKQATLFDKLIEEKAKTEAPLPRAP